MTDQSIVATPLADGRVRYTLGGPNWADRRIPDIRRPGETVQVDEDRMIDIIILGDGFTAASQFADRARRMAGRHLALKVYDTFAGCLRIRALYTPSVQPASSTRGSFYRCLTSSDGRSLATDRLNDEGETEDYDWWSADDADGRAFREAFWAGVDTFDIATERRYPLDLDVGGSNQAIHDDTLRDRYRNLIVSMLVQTSDRVDSPPRIPPVSTGIPAVSYARCHDPPRTRAIACGSHLAPPRFTSSVTPLGSSGMSTSRAAILRAIGSTRPRPASSHSRTSLLEAKAGDARRVRDTHCGRDPVDPPVARRLAEQDGRRAEPVTAGWLALDRRRPAPRRLALGLPLSDERRPRQFPVHPGRGPGPHDPTATAPTTPKPPCATMTGSVCGARSSSPSAYSKRPTSCSRTAIPATSPPRGSSGTAGGSIGSAPTTTSSSTSPDRSPTMRPATPRCSRTQRRAAVAIGPVLRADGRRRRRCHLASAAALGRRAVPADRTRGPPLAPPPSGPKQTLIIRACTDVAAGGGTGTVGTSTPKAVEEVRPLVQRAARELWRSALRSNPFAEVGYRAAHTSSVATCASSTVWGNGHGGDG